MPGGRPRKADILKNWQSERNRLVTRAFERLKKLEKLADKAVTDGKGAEALKLSEGVIKLLSQLDPLIQEVKSSAPKAKQQDGDSEEPVPFSL